jgi:hypothetical protein
MPHRERRDAVMPDRTLLSRTWWAVGPAFVVLAGRLAIDRACGDPYNLVPALASRAAIAWAMAAVYVLAHLWLLAAYVQTARASAALLPPPRALGAIWGSDRWKVWLLLFAVALEYAPLLLFRAVRSACG